MLLDGKWDHNSNVSLSSLLQFFMINFMDMCILNIIMGSLKNNSLHHSLSSDKSQKELWILIRKRRGRPCSRGEKYSVIILNKSTAARLHIKNGSVTSADKKAQFFWQRWVCKSRENLYVTYGTGSLGQSTSLAALLYSLSLVFTLGEG